MAHRLASLAANIFPWRSSTTKVCSVNIVQESSEHVVGILPEIVRVSPSARRLAAAQPLRQADRATREASREDSVTGRVRLPAGIRQTRHRDGHAERSPRESSTDGRRIRTQSIGSLGSQRSASMSRSHFPARVGPSDLGSLHLPGLIEDEAMPDVELPISASSPRSPSLATEQGRNSTSGSGLLPWPVTSPVQTSAHRGTRPTQDSFGDLQAHESSDPTVQSLLVRLRLEARAEDDRRRSSANRRSERRNMPRVTTRTGTGTGSENGSESSSFHGASFPRDGPSITLLSVPMVPASRGGSGLDDLLPDGDPLAAPLLD